MRNYTSDASIGALVGLLKFPSRPYVGPSVCHNFRNDVAIGALSCVPFDLENFAKSFAAKVFLCGEFVAA